MGAMVNGSTYQGIASIVSQSTRCTSPVHTDSIVIMENGVISGDILYKQIAVFEGGIINVAGMKRIQNNDEKVIDILPKVAE